MGDRGPEPEITSEDIIAVFEQQKDPCEPRTAKEIATELDCAKRTAHKHLKRTEEETRLKSKQIGARARAWWLPADCADS